KGWATKNATRSDEEGSSVFANGSCDAANSPSTLMNAGLRLRRCGAMDTRRKASAWMAWFPGIETATHLAHGRSHGWTTCRALSVRRNLRYGGLQCLAEDEGVPAPERPTSRHHGQRRISSLARNGAAHRGDGRDPAVPRALFPRPQPHRAGLCRSEEAPGVSGAGHPRRYRQDLSTIVDLAINSVKMSRIFIVNLRAIEECPHKKSQLDDVLKVTRPRRTTTRLWPFDISPLGPGCQVRRSGRLQHRSEN